MLKRKSRKIKGGSSLRKSKEDERVEDFLQEIKDDVNDLSDEHSDDTSDYSGEEELDSSENELDIDSADSAEENDSENADGNNDGDSDEGGDDDGDGAELSSTGKAPSRRDLKAIERMTKTKQKTLKRELVREAAKFVGLNRGPDPLELAQQSDSTDDEGMKNRIGNVPLEWYDEYDHVGYDVKGEKIIRKKKGDALDDFLAQQKGDYSRTVYDALNDEYVKLTDEEMNMIHRIRHGKFAHRDFNPYEDHPDFFSRDTSVEMIGNAIEPKRRFIPSKHEAKMVVKLVNAIRMGWIKPTGAPPEPKPPEVYQLWDTPNQDNRPKKLANIPAPKPKLPGHAESYNPPEEYLLTQEEKEKWEDQAPEDRELSLIPKKHDNLRSVGIYENLINERFERCLDLYLCARTRKTRLNVDPDSLIPQLPKPQDLRPFPHSLALEYLGHTGKVRSISVSPCGQWIASGSDDHTVRVWEVDTGRCFKRWDLGGIVDCVAWNPNNGIPLIAAAVGTKVLMLQTQTGSREEMDVLESLLQEETQEIEEGTKKKILSKWNPQLKVDGESNTDPTVDLEVVHGDVDSDEETDDSETASSGTMTAANDEMKKKSDDDRKDDDDDDDDDEVKWSRLCIDLKVRVKQIVWHHKGDYFATVSPTQTNTSVLIHRLSQRKSQAPFQKSKGLVQTVSFHPLKPVFMVVTKRNVRLYNLASQQLIKKLVCSARWNSCISVHPSGDHVIVGSFDRRLSWFDLDLSSQPYKTLKYHKRAIRSVQFHPRYPLFASASDDGSLHIFHGTVYTDLLTNPLIVPVKILKAHEPKNDLGILACAFHPSQPWIFSAGADRSIRLFT